MSKLNMPRFLCSFFSSHKPAVILFTLYLIIGLLIATDYGVSYDEPVERYTSLITYNYVWGKVLMNSRLDSVKNLFSSLPNLTDYHDRYYGTWLQTFTVAIEHIKNFQLGVKEIYLIRHIFTFLNYYVAGVCFYLILRKRFRDSIIPFIGTVLFIIYPRFFGESFYNIKDLLFYSWTVISTFFALLWIESRGKKFIIPTAFAMAVATNTRILGVAILLLAITFFIALNGFAQIKRPKIKIFRCSLLLAALFSIFYYIITPLLWKHPIKNAIGTFSHFLNFPNWSGRHFYLGEMIDSNVPWHYILVWMGVTTPFIYLLLFLIGVAACIFAAFKTLKASLANIKNEKTILTQESNKNNAIYSDSAFYDAFFFTMFFSTLLGYIILHINMYEGWRHAYFIFLPFLYISIKGLACFFYGRFKGTLLQAVVIVIVIVSCIDITAWLIKNHPYQYVYFNRFGRTIAKDNFTLDYWEVSLGDILEHILEIDDRPNILIYHTYPYYDGFAKLGIDTAGRFTQTDPESADYYLEHSRVPLIYANTPTGFEKIYAITVDGMEIARLYKRIVP